MLLMELKDELIFFFCPFLISNSRVQMVVPSLSALFADATRQMACNETPIFRSVQIDHGDDDLILFGSPGSFGQVRVEYLLPSVQTLDVSTTRELACNNFPFLCSMLLY